jgi:hypothetical protein
MKGSTSKYNVLWSRNSLASKHRFWQYSLFSDPSTCKKKSVKLIPPDTFYEGKKEEKKIGRKKKTTKEKKTIRFYYNVL